MLKVLRSLAWVLLAICPIVLLLAAVAEFLLILAAPCDQCWCLHIEQSTLAGTTRASGCRFRERGMNCSASLLRLIA